jgi:hypothetical protein
MDAVPDGYQAAGPCVVKIVRAQECAQFNCPQAIAFNKNGKQQMDLIKIRTVKA